MSISAVSLPLSLQKPLLLPKRADAVKQIALGALAELALAWTLEALCMPFYASGVSPVHLFGFSAIVVAVNLFLRLFGTAYAKNNWADHFLRESFCALSLTFLSGNALTLIHETGHAGAAKLLFEGTPTIRLTPFGGGHTRFLTKMLTRLGQQVGFRRSIFLITLSGPALALLAASIALIAGLALRRSHPKTSNLLLGIGLYNFFEHALYAHSALGQLPAVNSHDFVRLRAFGLHPLAAVSGIVALPLILMTGCYFLQKPDTKLRV